MLIAKKTFDDGFIFTLENKNGLKVELTDFGASIVSVNIADKNNNPKSISFGSEESNFYKNTKSYIGSSVGRFANRIIDGKFTLDGKQYCLPINNGKNHLHGGVKGFSFKQFDNYIGEGTNDCSVIFTYKSLDGEEGYPGNMDVAITYTVNENNELIINYKAVTDKATPINLTNHAYWNLNGQGNILDHSLTLLSDYYLPVNADCSATGEILKTSDTAFDFNKEKIIGKDINEVNGYDNCFIFNDTDINKCKAKLSSQNSGISMEIFTDKPAIQFYTGNNLKDEKTREGILNKYDTVCLETQYLPCAPNFLHFKSSILRPNELYNYTTIHRFSVKK